MGVEHGKSGLGTGSYSSRYARHWYSPKALPGSQEIVNPSNDFPSREAIY